MSAPSRQSCAIISRLPEAAASQRSPAPTATKRTLRGDLPTSTDASVDNGICDAPDSGERNIDPASVVNGICVAPHSESENEVEKPRGRPPNGEKPPPALEP
eukprot:335912-Prymnesium_polylepis.1